MRPRLGTFIWNACCRPPAGSRKRRLGTTKRPRPQSRSTSSPAASERCVVGIEWKQSDQGQQGPVSPALSADVVIQLKRTPIAEPAELSQIALVQVPAEPSPELINLHYRDAKGRFEFQHGRDWHVVSPAT